MAATTRTPEEIGKAITIANEALHLGGFTEILVEDELTSRDIGECLNWDWNSIHEAADLLVERAQWKYNRRTSTSTQDPFRGLA